MLLAKKYYICAERIGDLVMKRIFNHRIIIFLHIILLSFIWDSLLAQALFERHTIDSNFRAFFIKSFDLNQDKNIDILSGFNDLAWWENDGMGNFSKHLIDKSVSGVWSIFPIDLDKDNDFDLLIADAKNNDVVWYRNDNFYFKRIVIQTNFYNAESVAGGDIDKDGDIDIVSLTWADSLHPGIVALWKNNGHNQFSRQDLATNFMGGHKIVFTDLDKDGNSDIIGCSGTGSEGLFWFKNRGNASFDKHRIFKGGVVGFTMVDFDGNGTLDLVFSRHSAGQIYLSNNNGGGSFTNRVLFDGLNWPHFPAVTDFNKDGRLDIIVVNRNSNDIVCLENMGEFNFSYHFIDSMTKPFIVDVADFNNDGEIDIVSGSAYDEKLYWWENKSSTQPPKSITVIFPNGGEILNSGENYTIQWQTGGTIPDVNLFYSVNNGNSWKFISSTSNSGNYLWHVPDVQSDLCLIKVEDKNKNAVDISDGSFTILTTNTTVSDTMDNFLVVEAEEMQNKINGHSIAGGWALENDGYLSDPVYFLREGNYQFKVVVKGQPGQGGNPTMLLQIDGIQLAPAEIVNQNNYQIYHFYSFISSGEHPLKISFAEYKSQQILDIDKIELQNSACDDLCAMTSLANSILVKIPDPKRYGLFDWAMANMLFGLCETYDLTRDNRYLDYIKSWADAHLDASGNTDVNLASDWNQATYILYWLYDKTNNDKYIHSLFAIDSKDISKFSRISNGAFVHKNHDQIWIDSIHGLVYFMMALYKLNHDPYYLRETVDQIIAHADHLQDPVTGLFYHAYDEDGSASWADPTTHLSPHLWGRGNGWIFQALVDFLEFLPDHFARREKLLQILSDLGHGIVSTQDSASGLWYTVLDQPDRQGNYLEVSASCLLAGSLEKAIKLGYVPNTYQKYADNADLGLNREIYSDYQNIFYVTDISGGTGPGDFNYYTSRVKSTGYNYLYGSGLFLSAKYRFIHDFSDNLLTISGNVKYGNENPISNTVIGIKGNSTDLDTTDIAGNFSFSSRQSRDSYILFPSKVLTTNVQYTILTYDAALTARHAVGLEQFSSVQQIAADVDQNGQVSFYDAGNIARYAIGLPRISNTFTGDWHFIPDTINIQSLKNDTTDISFEGVILGDVDFSWGGSNLAKNNVTTTFLIRQSDLYNISQNNDTTIIDFLFPEDQNILSFDLYLKYSSDNYSLSGSKLLPLDPNLRLNVNNSKGTLKIGGYSLDFLKKDSQLRINLISSSDLVDKNVLIDKFIINNIVLLSGIEVKGNLYSQQNVIPESFHLYQNYPNPFNSETQIDYSLPISGSVNIILYDIRGRRINTLVHENQNAGQYFLVWNGKDFSGKKVSAGIYILKFTFNNQLIQTIKINYLS